MIMTIQSNKRLRLITPIMGSGKVLKSCIRCRQHKTKCDAFTTNPLPCTHCFKKNLNCTLDIIRKPPHRATEILEKLDGDIQNMKETLNRLISKKEKMIGLLLERSKTIQNTAPPTPSISEIQTCLDSPTEFPLALPSIKKAYQAGESFSINVNLKTCPISISKSEALEHFQNYEKNFNRFLPIFPDNFFTHIDLRKMAEENDLLFWSIITTSHLNKSNFSQYLSLSKHIKSLVVEKCWFLTPRSVYLISSLLILTTWPLPTDTLEKISDNVSIKYLSLMKSLALQFGLHKVEFIHEFSHKTELNISNEVNLNNLIRERIYKFVNINSNYWLIYLGLSNNNCNGLQNDYIINKANKDLFASVSKEDHYINSILKVSMIQTRLNENLNDLINNKDCKNNASKLINLHMFEVILNNQQNLLDPSNLIKLSIEFSKLQLYVYSFSNLDVTVFEYKTIIKNALNSCYLILELFKKEFGDVKFFNLLPFHYKSIIELAALMMIRVYKSPLLDTKDEYDILKEKFNECYSMISGDQNEQEQAWLILNSKLIKILHRFDKIDNMTILEKVGSAFFLINRMKNQLASSLLYELIWYIYDEGSIKRKENAEDGKNGNVTTSWLIFGLNDRNDKGKETISYFLSNNSIFIK